MTWWWCLEHKRTEQDEGCRSANRLGPYDSEQQAATAIERTRARSAEQDARDKAEDDLKER
ncbi:MAG: hypothetical protein WC809_10945 [Sinimarinibacterium sp.]|jgi:hypothetical protein